jgi:uncharacterized protein
MKKNLIGLIILITASNILPAQDTLTFYFDSKWKEISNKDEAEFYRKAFLVNDIWTVRDYYKSNKIQMTGTFKSKKLTIKNGHFVYYYENGQKQSEGDFVNDVEVGKWTSWFESGKLKSESTFPGNSKSYWKYWYESGELKSAGKFLFNNRDNVWNFWYKNGQLESIETFKNGFLTLEKYYYKNGQMNFTGRYLNGNRNGDWTFYDADGRIYYYGSYTNGNRDGNWIRFFKEGKMQVNYSRGEIVNKEFGGMVRKDRESLK